MVEIEMDDLDRPEERQEEQQGEEDTNVDERDESMVIIDTSNPDAAGIPNPRKDAGAIRRVYTEDKKASPGKWV